MGVANERGGGESGEGECSFQHTHPVFLVQVDSILDPGERLHCVYHTHNKVDAHDGDEPGELTITSAVLVQAIDKRSREDEREDVDKGCDSVQRERQGVSSTEKGMRER